MSYQVWSVVFGEQPSASKWNILGTNDASFNDGTGIADAAVITRILAGGAATTDKNTAVVYSDGMSAVGITTTDQVIASRTLPSYGANHIFLIIAHFEWTHAGAASVRDYTGSIKNGTTVLNSTVMTNENTTYARSMSVSSLFTSSGGETINFTISRTTDNGGTSISRANYTIVDLGRA